MHDFPRMLAGLDCLEWDEAIAGMHISANTPSWLSNPRTQMINFVFLPYTSISFPSPPFPPPFLNFTLKNKVNYSISNLYFRCFSSYNTNHTQYLYTLTHIHMINIYKNVCSKSTYIN